MIEEDTWIVFENPETGYLNLCLGGSDNHFSFEDIGHEEIFSGNYEECNNIRELFYEDCIYFYNKQSKSFIMFTEDKLNLIIKNNPNFLNY